MREEERKKDVPLASQLLSESIAISLRFCLPEQISKFEGCGASINFIMMFNTLLDIKNWWILNASGCKSPIQRKIQMR